MFINSLGTDKFLGANIKAHQNEHDRYGRNGLGFVV